MNTRKPTIYGLLLLVLLGGCSTTAAPGGLLNFSELSAEITVTRETDDEGASPELIAAR